MQQLNKQMIAIMTYGLVPNIVKMPSPGLFIVKHDDKTIRQFIYSYDIYLKLTGIKDENTKALFAKNEAF